MSILTPELLAKFNRLIILNQKIKNLPDMYWLTDKQDKEYKQLHNELMEEMEPVLQQIAAAGLLTIVVTDDHKHMKKKFSSVEYEVGDIFDNGNFWISVNTNSAMPTHRLRGDGEPNIGWGADANFTTYAHELFVMASGKKGSFQEWLKANDELLKKRFADYKMKCEIEKAHFKSFDREL